MVLRNGNSHCSGLPALRAPPAPTGVDSHESGGPSLPRRQCHIPHPHPHLLPVIGIISEWKLKAGTTGGSETLLWPLCKVSIHPTNDCLVLRLVRAKHFFLFQPQFAFNTILHQLQMYSKVAGKPSTLQSVPVSPTPLPQVPTRPRIQLFHHHWLYYPHCNSLSISEPGGCRRHSNPLSSTFRCPCWACYWQKHRGSFSFVFKKLIGNEIPSMQEILRQF